MSSEIVRYGNTALAAGAMHQDITGPAVRSQLREIYQCIPQGESAIVQFCISTDDVASQGTRVHYAATAQFKNITGKSLNVQVTIASYESGRYRTPELPIAALEDADALDLENDSVNPNSALATSSGSSRTISNEVEVVRHPFINNEEKRLLAGMDQRDYQPHLVITKAVQSIFPSGVPLPAHQQFHYCTFSVRLSFSVGENVRPYFTLHRHVRGLDESVGKRYEPASRPVRGNDWDGKEYKKAEEEAAGQALPSLFSREKNVRLLGAANLALTPTPALGSSNSGASSQIKE